MVYEKIHHGDTVKKEGVSGGQGEGGTGRARVVAHSSFSASWVAGQYSDLLCGIVSIRTIIVDIPAIFESRKEVFDHRMHYRIRTLVRFQISFCDVGCV